MRTDWTIYDSAGGVVKTIENYIDGDPATGTSDEDVTALTTYAPGGQIATYTAVNPATGNQTTTYVYGTTLSDSGVARGDLLRAVIYPDSDDTPSLGNGTDGIYDRVEYKYNRLGQQIEVKDQNQTVHDYSSTPSAGRRRIGDLPSGNPHDIDDTVLRIDRTYEVRGMIENIDQLRAMPPSGMAPSSTMSSSTTTIGAFWTTEFQSHYGLVQIRQHAARRVRLRRRLANGRPPHEHHLSQWPRADLRLRIRAGRCR